MQELWLLKVGWDDPVPSSIKHKWSTIREDLTSLTRLSIPRWFNTLKNTVIELHGFSDASQLAMSTVVYLTVKSPSTGAQSTLICSKTKVAPLKKITIPLLELSAALLLAKLIEHLSTQLQFNIESINLLTDSRITLDWIKSPPSRWKEFVCNRVVQIQKLTEHTTWRHIPGTQNPADCASRGISTEQLVENELWWRGLPWIVQRKSNWPEQKLQERVSCPPEERPGYTYVATTRASTFADEYIARYSSLTKLIRHTSIILRLRSLLLKRPVNTRESLEQARKFWIKSTQAEHFANEIRALQRGNLLPSTNPLCKLTAFIDAEGILRVGGRSEHTTLSYENKHQAILPKESKFGELIIEQAHKLTLHGGTQLTLSQVRQRYWIISGRASVKEHITNCVECTRQRGIRAHQKMGQLPLCRVTPSRAFTHTGIDYAGPLSLKTWKGRGAKMHKGWVCAFVCMSTSAAHLEMVSDYSTEGFLATYRRFVARRGIPSHLYSDCGANFVGADRELESLFTQYKKEQEKIQHKVEEHGTRWHFNPPAAPHMGGKWEAVIKSTKYHLKRTLGDTTLTFEEATTLLSQIEAILNSRPLEPVSDDPTDPSALTPGHFLIGAPLLAVPEPCLLDLAINRLSRWQFIQQRAQQFWKLFMKQYIHRQQCITKWYHPKREIGPGSLVLILSEGVPPTKWPLARVIEIHEGQDKLTRIVTLKTATGTLERSLAKLVILPIITEQTSAKDG